MRGGGEGGGRSAEGDSVSPSPRGQLGREFNLVCCQARKAENDSVHEVPRISFGPSDVPVVCWKYAPRRAEVYDGSRMPHVLERQRREAVFRGRLHVLR